MNSEFEAVTSSTDSVVEPRFEPTLVAESIDESSVAPSVIAEELDFAQQTFFAQPPVAVEPLVAVEQPAAVDVEAPQAPEAISVNAVEAVEEIEAVGEVVEPAETETAATETAEAAAAEAEMKTEETDAEEPSGFALLKLRKELHDAIRQSGYVEPSEIQARTIPHLLEGRDVFGRAQTGTGKTAAFALPLLSRIDFDKSEPQVLVLTPTRELAIQVAESFETYARNLRQFRCVAIYGGQEYGTQIRALSRGVQVVVGTPGRVIDHAKRGTLKLNKLDCLVLDEADEMLRMGFAEDVQWVLEKSPAKRQIAMFSATLPEPIRRIANTHMTDAVEIHVENKTQTAATIRQRSLAVNGRDKFDALTRILESETTDGVLVFVRTKNATGEVAERLTDRGYLASPLNGDIPQSLRERTIDQLKANKIDIVVATDVAARGLDVSRISHVVNYDMPHDVEGYIHRIGRTGRAGRDGEAILLITPKETHLLRQIQHQTRQTIERMELPLIDVINERRIERFKKRITAAMEASDLQFFKELVEKYQSDTEVDLATVAAALAKMAQGDEPLLLKEPPRRQRETLARNNRDTGENRAARGEYSRSRDQERKSRDSKSSGGNDGPKKSRSNFEMESFRIDAGSTHGVRVGNIVGAIANEAGLQSSDIGRVKIFDSYSTVDLPLGMPNELLTAMQSVWIGGRPMKLSRFQGGGGGGGQSRRPQSDRPESDRPHRKHGKPHQRPGSRGSRPS